MRFDTTKFDAALVLTHVRSKGKWGVEVSSIAGKTLRIGGQIDSTGIDMMQTAALLTGIAELRSQRMPVSNPRLLVTSNRTQFLAALKSDNLTELTVPDHVKAELQRELRGLQVTYDQAEPKLAADFSNWTNNLVRTYAPAFPIAALSQLA